MKPIKTFFTIVLGAVLAFFISCSGGHGHALKPLLTKDSARVRVTYFFNFKNNSEVEKLDVPLQLPVSRSLVKSWLKDKAVVQYDDQTAENTLKSLEAYLKQVNEYRSFLVSFETDSFMFQVQCTERLDVTHVVMVRKVNANTRFINDYYFVAGTILKTVERERTARNAGNFSEEYEERETVSCFDENRLFRKTVTQGGKTEEMNVPEKTVIEDVNDAFLMRQFCRDVVIQLKGQYSDWFLSAEKAGN